MGVRYRANSYRKTGPLFIYKTRNFYFSSCMLGEEAHVIYDKRITGCGFNTTPGENIEHGVVN